MFAASASQPVYPHEHGGWRGIQLADGTGIFVTYPPEKGLTFDNDRLAYVSCVAGQIQTTASRRRAHPARRRGLGNADPHTGIAAT